MTYENQPAPKPGMSTGKKIALFGCLPVTVLGLLIVGGCAVVGGAVVNEVDKSVKADAAEDKRAATEDVQLLSCAVKDEGIGPDVKAQVKITNNGKKRANYYVEGEFLNPQGDKVGELFATVDNLEKSKSSTQPFTGLFTSEQLAGADKGTCKILKVTRDEWSAATN